MHCKSIPLLLLAALAACSDPGDDPQMTGGHGDTDEADGDGALIVKDFQAPVATIGDCNPDCTTPGTLAWSATWDNHGSPAGIHFMGDGTVQLAATLSAGKDSIWNLQIDAETGELLSAKALTPVGGSYTAMASARVGDGTVIAARNRDNGSEHSTLLSTGPDATLVSVFDQAGIAPWQRIEGGPDSEAFAVLRNTGSQLNIREFDGGTETFAYDAHGSSASIALGYADSVLHMAGKFQLFGPPGLLLFSWPNAGDGVIGGIWNGGGVLDDVSAHAIVGTRDGGQLVVGAYAQDGVMQSVIAKFSGVTEAPPTWVLSGGDGTATAAAAQDVCETPDGDLIVVGWSLEDAGVHRTRIRKLTANGGILWDHTLDDGVVDRNTVTCDDEGGALLAGTVAGQIWYGRIAP